jgi:hypothetical protein
MAIFIPALSSRFGLVGAAYGDLVCTILLTITMNIIARVVMKQISWPLMSTVTLPVIAALVTGALAWTVGVQINHGMIRLVVELALILSCYPLFILMVGGRARLFDLASLLRHTFRRSAIVAQPTGEVS